VRSDPRHLSVSLNFSAESSCTRKVSALKELKLKRKYTGEKQAFIVGRIGALVLATGGTPSATSPAAAGVRSWPERGVLRLDERQRPFCSFFSSFH
jgi:hypothetical protein